MLKKVLDVLSAANTLTLPMDTRAIADHFGISVYTYSLAQPPAPLSLFVIGQWQMDMQKTLP